MGLTENGGGGGGGTEIKRRTERRKELQDVALGSVVIMEVASLDANWGLTKLWFKLCVAGPPQCVSVCVCVFLCVCVLLCLA